MSNDVVRLSCDPKYVCYGVGKGKRTQGKLYKGALFFVKCFFSCYSFITTRRKYTPLLVFFLPSLSFSLSIKIYVDSQQHSFGHNNNVCVLYIQWLNHSEKNYIHSCILVGHTPPLLFPHSQVITDNSDIASPSHGHFSYKIHNSSNKAASENKGEKLRKRLYAFLDRAYAIAIPCFLYYYYYMKFCLSKMQ